MADVELEGVVDRARSFGSPLGGDVEFEFVVEPLWATMLFRSASMHFNVVLADGHPERLVALGDVRDREVRIVPLRVAREEAEDARCLQVWRDL